MSPVVSAPQGFHSLWVLSLVVSVWVVSVGLGGLLVSLLPHPVRVRAVIRASPVMPYSFFMGVLPFCLVD